jgi:xylose isomerase
LQWRIGIRSRRLDLTAFGGPTINRPWMLSGDPIALAKMKADAAFELFRVLDLPFSAGTMPI